MKINLSNVENIVFYDKNIHNILPELIDIFERWMFGVRSNNRRIIKDSMLDFINNITPDQLERLESYFDCSVTIEKIEPCLVKNLRLENLDKCKGFNLCIFREEDQIYVSCWR